MGTQIHITPKSGLTVGATAVTSGTDTGVFFQQGGVLQQSPKFTFDDTLLTLDGGTSTANVSIFEIKGAGGQRGLRVWQDNSARIGGNTNYFVTKGVGSGGATNNFYSSDSHFCFGGGDLTKGWVHIGVNDNNPQARLDVRAQGALSTDIALRVRNSANTANLFETRGDGNSINFGDLTSNRFLFGDAVLLSGGSNVARYAGTAFIKHRFTNNGTTAYFEIDPANQIIHSHSSMRMSIGATTAAARLDVRAQGALSTDIALRVRNSADNANIGIITGDGAMTLGVTTNANTKLSISGSEIGVSSNATRVGFSAVVNLATQINSAAFDGFVRVSGGAPSGNYYGIISSIDSGNVNTILHGIRASATGSGTNYGGYFRAYGGTSNHAIYVLDGDMRFGATTTNKIGFWNTNPILQPTTAIAASTLVSNLGTPLTDTDTFDGYTMKQVVKALRNMGILA